MTTTAKIHLLSSIAQSLLQASIVVEQSVATADPLTLGQASDDLFALLPIDEMKDKVGAPGFEKIGEIISCMDAANHEFLRGDTQAIRLTTAFVKNDFNGNDHTSVTLVFSAGTQSIQWKTTLVELRDSNVSETESSTLEGVHTFLFCGDAVTPELHQFLREELVGMADAYITQNINFPYYVSAADVEAAQTLIAEHKSLLDSIAA